MTKIYIVKVMNRFDNDRTTDHYFTAEDKAVKYAERINAKYEAARAAKDYGRMVDHVDMGWGIKAVDADED